MDPIIVDSIKLIAPLAPTLVAILALILGFRNEARNQKRFNEQLSQSREIAHASARPLLSAGREGYVDEKAITLENHGPGTAIINVLKFVRGDRNAIDIAELLELENDVEILWNESTEFTTPYYIAGKSTEEAFRITKDRLKECRVPAERITPLLDEIEKQLDEIEITIEYQDVFGKEFRYTG